jgi:heat shock protein HtpX
VERRYGRDLGLSLRMAAAMVLLAALYLPALLWLGSFAYGFTSSPVAGALAAAAALIFLAAVPVLSERLALTSAGTRLLEPGEEPRLRRTVERLCAFGDLPMPRLGMAPSDVPNAFSAGRSPTRAVIVVTRGLLRRLDDRELEAVLAHELAHVANRDAFVMTLANAPAALLRKVVWGVARLPFSAPGLAKVPAALFVLYLIPVLIAGWIAYAFATLLVMAISRYREYAADRGAAVLTGAPEQLMSALQRIAAELPLIPAADLRSVSGVNALFILPAQSGSGRFEVDPLRMFPTHPPLGERLERLGELARNLGRAQALERPEPTSVVPHLPVVSRAENPQALYAFLLALLVYVMLVGSWMLEPAPVGNGVMLVGLIGSAAFVGGIVFALQGIGRASNGASGMGLAVAGLVLLVGPWALAILAVAVFAFLAAFGVHP